MSLKVGDRLGHYNVTALIGEGGMGQVYRATDTQLGRDVALKILPDAFAADTDRLARFQREARVLASLNHPGIAAIYGIEEDEAGGTRALVLELVEGPTLADRIAQGAMRVDDALPLAGQIAVALEAAHEAGVIHRDLKPANIKVREDGTVKVLDFGLAKALDTTPVGDPSQSPTLTAAATQMGVIMGTAAYMSPQQARGKPVDKRADIWAFGCVLYEMLAGERAFQGEDVSLTLASVMKSELHAKTLPRDVPPTLRTVLRQCLEKDSKDRLRDMGDVRLAMTGAFESPAPVDAVAVGPASAGWRRLWPVLVGVIVGVVGASLALWSLTRADGSVSRPARRFAIGPPPEAALALQPGVIIALSPDGRTMVYSGRGADPGSTRLYRRPMDQLDLVPVRDTEDAVGPFFSPDGEWVAFWEGAAGPLRKVSLAGGSASTVAGTPGGSGSWGPDDTIVFGQRGAGLAQVSANSGDPTPLTTPEAGETHQTPHFLPGGGRCCSASWGRRTSTARSQCIRSRPANGGRCSRGVPPAIHRAMSSRRVATRCGRRRSTSTPWS